MEQLGVLRRRGCGPGRDGSGGLEQGPQTRTLYAARKECGTHQPSRTRKSAPPAHKKRIEKLQYMHMNPVKRGLVVHPKDWPWNSFSFSSKRTAGLAPIDPLE